MRALLPPSTVAVLRPLYHRVQRHIQASGNGLSAAQALDSQHGVHHRLVSIQGTDPDALDRPGKTPLDCSAEKLWPRGMVNITRLMDSEEKHARIGVAGWVNFG